MQCASVLYNLRMSFLSLKGNIKSTVSTQSGPERPGLMRERCPLSLQTELTSCSGRSGAKVEPEALTGGSHCGGRVC